MKINPNKYIVSLPSSPCPKDFIEEVKAGIKTIGMSGQKAIQSQNLKYVLAQKASDAYPELKGVTPRGWTSDLTWDQSEAICRNGEIGCFSIPERREMSSIIRHETGHEVDLSFVKSIGKMFTATKGYTDNYLSDIGKLKERLPNTKLSEEDLDYFIQQSTPKKATMAGKEETFAEIYAKLHGGSISNADIKGFDKIIDGLFPNTIAYVKKLLWLLGDK